MRPYASIAAVVAIVVMAMLLLQSGCSAPPTILTPYERQLGVQDGVAREFHSSLYYPKGLALQFPGYVVGIEKASQSTVQGPGATGIFPAFLQERPAYFVDGEKDTQWGLGSLHVLKKLKSDPKSMFVSHVTRFFFVQDGDQQAMEPPQHTYTYMESCFIYNAFRSPYFSERRSSDTQASSSRRWTDLSGVLAWKDCPDAPAWDHGQGAYDNRNFYANGEPAITALADAVARDLRSNGYTHVLVMVMGWNTAQDEAIRNFNDMVGNLVEAAKEGTGRPRSDQTPFRPLVIGVSWPSYWYHSSINAFSYFNKANDADELGISWINLLVNRELPRAMESARAKVPVIMIGHSFGARVVTQVAGASPALKTDGDGGRTELYCGANLVVGLEGAVSINRFWNGQGKPASDEGAPLRDFKKLKATHFAYTASKHDSAAGGPVFWFDPTGSIKSYELACGNARGWRKDVFQCFRARDVSGLDAPVDEQRPWSGFKICETDDPAKCAEVGQNITMDAPPSRVLYIDASDGITEFNTLGTAGTAHSDIYRLPMGRLMWILISSLPAESTPALQR